MSRDLYFNGPFGDTFNWDLIRALLERSDLWRQQPVLRTQCLVRCLSICYEERLYVRKGLRVRFRRFHMSLHVEAAVRCSDRRLLCLLSAASGFRGTAAGASNRACQHTLLADLGWRGTGGTPSFRFGRVFLVRGGWRRRPIQLLDQNFRSIFTTPQDDRQQMGLIALNCKYSLNDIWSLQAISTDVVSVARPRRWQCRLT